MIPSELLTIIGRRHFIAEVRTGTAKQALGVVEALARGGIGVFEISVAIPGSNEILHHYSSQTEIFIGAGGVTDIAEAEAAAKAGARFVISPIMSPDLLQACNDLHITCVLGALTPTEVIAAHRAGAGMVKVFPANALGGSHYIRSLFREFSNLSLMVAGGITLETLPEYLTLPVRSIALGSTLMPRSLVERGDWVSITSIARRYVEYIMQWEAATAGAPTPQVAASRPMMSDTVMAPVPPPAYQPPPIAYPPQAYPIAPAAQYPTAPSQPGIFDPAHSAGQTPPAPSQPAGPISPPAPSQPAGPISPPAPPASTAGKEFKPWDSKPLPGSDGDDWLR